MSMLSRSGEPVRAIAGFDDEAARLFVRHASELPPARQELMKRLFVEVLALDAAGAHEEADNLIQLVVDALGHARA